MPVCDRIGVSVLIVVALFFGLVTNGAVSHGATLTLYEWWQILKAILIISGVVWIPLRLLDYIAGGPKRRAGQWTISAR